MSGTVSNGRRVNVAFGRYTGLAGVQDRDEGVMEVAFRGDPRGLQGVDSGTVDGAPVVVQEVARSQHIPGMVRLLVTAVTPAS